MKKTDQKSLFVATLLVAFMFTIFFTSSCKKDPVSSGGGGGPVTVPPPPLGKINPADANAVTTALGIDSSSRVIGNIPPYQKQVGDSISITGYQRSIEVTAGGEIIIPFNYRFVTGQSYKYNEFNIKVVGADSTIKIRKSLTNLSQQGVFLQKIKVPSRISYGDFRILVSVNLVRSDGKFYQSPSYTIDVSVSAPKTCGEQVSGSEGLTFTNLTLGAVKGTASVSYDTYSVKDRIDVYYNNVWVAGTAGTNPGPVPPQKNCADVLPGDGFVGQTGTLNFSYDPAVSQNVTVVVSGCLGSGTAWDYTVNCPQ
jgi:hypothetical protein